MHGRSHLTFDKLNKRSPLHGSDMIVQFGIIKAGAIFKCAGVTWMKKGKNHASPVKPCSVAFFKLNPAVAAIFRAADEVVLLD